MNILLINLTRFGDLLQTQPVILGLKEQGYRVGLLCLNNFAATLPLLRGVDCAFSLPGNSLLAKMEDDWRTALQEIDALLTRIQSQFPVDVVYNNTATLSARLLARRLCPQHGQILGFGLDADGFGLSGNAWATFLQGGSKHRDHCPFNIVDMFRAAAGLSHQPPLSGLNPPDAATLARSLDLLHELGPAQSDAEARGYVGFQLGASDPKRQWPVAFFAAVGQRLWEEHRLCPVLLGTPSEKALGEEYATHSQHPFTDLIGRTSIPELAGVLEHCELLISNDTGTMHLAAGLRRPVLGIFLATAQPWDTAPYAPDCCCLEPASPCHPCGFGTVCPHHFHCRERISADTVYTLAAAHLRTGQWPALPHAKDARVWLTAQDDNGFACLKSLSGHDKEERSQSLYFLRLLFCHIIDALNNMPTSLPAPHTLKHMPHTMRHELAEAFRQGAELLHLLAEQCVLAQRVPQLAQKVLGTTGRVQELLENCHALGALAFLWRNLLQERGGDVQNIRQTATQLSDSFEQWHNILQNTPA